MPQLVSIQEKPGQLASPLRKLEIRLTVGPVGLSLLLNPCLIDGALPTTRSLRSESLPRISLPVVTLAVWDVTEETPDQPGPVSSDTDLCQEISTETTLGANLTNSLHVLITSSPRSTQTVPVMLTPLSVKENVTLLMLIATSLT